MTDKKKPRKIRIVDPGPSPGEGAALEHALFVRHLIDHDLRFVRSGGAGLRAAQRIDDALRLKEEQGVLHYDLHEDDHERLEAAADDPAVMDGDDPYPVMQWVNQETGVVLRRQPVPAKLMLPHIDAIRNAAAIEDEEDEEEEVAAEKPGRKRRRRT